MQMIEVAIKNIVEGENSRQSYNDAELSELMTSLKQSGQLQPIGLKELPGGKYELNYGFRRYFAAKKLGWKTIQAMALPQLDEENTLIINAIENMQRKDVPMVQQGRIFCKLEKQGLSLDQIAARTGKRKQIVSQCIQAYRGIPNEVRRRIVGGLGVKAANMDGKLSAGNAFEALRVISKYKLKERQKKQLYDYASKKGVGSIKMGAVSALLEKGVSLSAAMKRSEEIKAIPLRIVLPLEVFRKEFGSNSKNAVKYIDKILKADKRLKVIKVGT